MMTKKEHKPMSFSRFFEHYKEANNWEEKKHDLNYTVEKLQAAQSAYKILFNKLEAGVLRVMIKYILTFTGFEVDEMVELINHRLITEEAAKNYAVFISQGAKFNTETMELVNTKYLEMLAKDLHKANV